MNLCVSVHILKLRICINIFWPVSGPIYFSIIIVSLCAEWTSLGCFPKYSVWKSLEVQKNAILVVGRAWMLKTCNFNRKRIVNCETFNKKAFVIFHVDSKKTEKGHLWEKQKSVLNCISKPKKCFMSYMWS